MEGDSPMARRKSTKKSHDDAPVEHETKSASKRKTTKVEPTPVFSPNFLYGAIVVLAILVIISAYFVGFKFGQMDQVDGNGVTPPATTATTPAPAQAAQPATPPPPKVPKQAIPEVELFIMSYCPYGLQMQKAFVQAQELLGDEANMKVKWVSYSMHGEKEMQDNTREYCIQKDQPEKFIAYEKCFVEKTDYVACAAATGVDTAKVESCYAATDAKYGITASFKDTASWLSGRYPHYNVDKELNEKYGVRGSPTMVINGQSVQVSRSAEAVKQAICNAFTTPPADCDKTLNSNQETPGPGPIGTGSGAPAAANAGCGG